MKDILIISYNEGAKRFDDSNCDEIINQILVEEPSFIYVATQESISGGVEDHYQHHLRYLLEDLNYQLLKKYDASVSLPTIEGIIVNKNVRSRIYFNKNKVCFDNKDKVKELVRSKSIDIPKENKKKICFRDCYKEEKIPIQSSNKLFSITNTSTKESKESGFKVILDSKLDSTLFKGSICTELKFTYDEIEYKFIFVNSHFFYKKKFSTGIEKREEEFEKLIKEFTLVQKWNEGYNIFFCGDLNFRLFSAKYLNKINNIPEKIQENENQVEPTETTGLLNTQKSSEEIKDELKKKLQSKSINIVKEYITKRQNPNLKNTINNNFKKTSELYQFLKRKQRELEEELKQKNNINTIDQREMLRLVQTQSIPLNNERYAKINRNIMLRQKTIDFYKALQNSIDKLGIHLTAKYKEPKKEITKDIIKNKTKELFKKEVDTIINSDITNVFNIFPKDKYVRIPSQTDVILYALSELNNISIDPKNFQMHLSPYKSDHKMVSLFIDLIQENNNQKEDDIKERNKQIKEFKEIFKKLFNELENIIEFTSNNKYIEVTHNFRKIHAIYEKYPDYFTKNKILNKIYLKLKDIQKDISVKTVQKIVQKNSSVNRI